MFTVVRFYACNVRLTSFKREIRRVDWHEATTECLRAVKLIKDSRLMFRRVNEI